MDWAQKLGRLIKDPSALAASLKFQTGRLLYPRYKRSVVVLFRYTRALGDNLMLTTVAREVRKRNPEALIHVVTGLPEIFARNPDVDFVSLEPERPTPGLGAHLIRYEHRFPWEKHLLYYCLECVDIRDKIDLRTYIYPSDTDWAWAEKILEPWGGYRPILVNRHAGPRTEKKNWPTDYWRQVIEIWLQAGWPVIDIGAGVSEPLSFPSDNWLDLVGKTSIHQLAALMARSHLLAGAESGATHLAASCGLPAISIVGGRQPGVASQYPGCISLTSQPSCRNCWEQGPCEHDLRCLREIKPSAILDAVDQLNQ